MKKQYVSADFRVLITDKNIIATSETPYEYKENLAQAAVVKTVSGSTIFG